MPKTDHIHKLKRVKYRTGTVMYFCTGATCTKKFAPALALGKQTICWRCEEPFEMNEYSIRLVKPHCQKCHEPKKGTVTQALSIANDIQPLMTHEPIIPPASTTIDNLLAKLKQTREEEDNDI